MNKANEKIPKHAPPRKSWYLKQLLCHYLSHSGFQPYIQLFFILSTLHLFGDFNSWPPY